MGQYYKPSILKKNWKLAKNPVKKAADSWQFGCGLKLMEHSYCGNAFVNAVALDLAMYHYGYPFVWCGDYADEVENLVGTHDIYSCAEEATEKFQECSERNPFKYLVNLTKKEYCRIPKWDGKEYYVHPLPLLTCSGNGRGGGDYGINDERVGSWAFDRIGVTNDEADIKGLKEISGFFEMDD